MNWLKQLSQTKKILLGLFTFVAIGAAGSHGTHSNSTSGASPTPATKAPLSKSDVKPQPSITTALTTETQDIPFVSTTVDDSSLAQGTSKVTTAGVNGVKTITYEITSSDGVQTAKKQVKEEVTTQPVNQVTSNGTYVAPTPSPQPSCPNGTYVNSVGNTVCSPYQSSSAPAGATARCVDGTYSFSQSHSGTCSHHGGVAEWL
jgi:hypothetical protein